MAIEPALGQLTPAKSVAKRLLVVLALTLLIAGGGATIEIAFGEAEPMETIRSWLLPTTIAAATITAALEVPKVTVQLREATEAVSVELTEVRHQWASRQPQPSGLNTATLAAGPNRYFFDGVTVTPHEDAGRRHVDVRKQGISPAEYASLRRALANPNAPTGWHLALGIGGRTFNIENCQVTPNAPIAGDHYVDIRAFTDESEHSQVLTALAATAEQGA